MDGNKTKSLFYSAEEVIDMLGLGKTSDMLILTRLWL